MHEMNRPLEEEVDPADKYLNPEAIPEDVGLRIAALEKPLMQPIRRIIGHDEINILRGIFNSSAGIDELPLESQALLVQAKQEFQNGLLQDVPDDIQAKLAD